MKSNKHCTILKIKCSFGFFSLANITYELGKFSFTQQCLNGISFRLTGAKSYLFTRKVKLLK